MLDLNLKETNIGCSLYKNMDQETAYVESLPNIPQLVEIAKVM
jgi:tetrahydromethanopterin S-methyltransferase subunit F